ncbi:pyridoxal phosphate-dependent transferase [Diplogelasinospora grovesii]|uniref:Glutamate decarboxylase n=1 Tax=Diplogelasinospora grovesii TaxID=303347 RepID=A0AAN6N1G4_9PEZI|nr:pyridoxal phosphate-dependent transferase [Diplogelasinospora grovesii]
MPRNEMPEEEMPRGVAYRMIQDDLAIDGTPALNYAEKLMVNVLSKNVVNHESYPGRSFDAVGTSTAGSSEAILLATLAMKKRWANKRRAAGKDCSKPNLVMSSAVQVCWKKAARYFDIEEKYVYCAKDRYTIDPSEATELVDENTIGICSIMGTTYTGEYGDTKAINDLLVERDLDIPIHVDAASGGFVAPFVNPDLIWDFRLEKVVSINVSGHKYGLVYAGIGWVIWRGAEYLPKELTFNMNYLGAEQATFTLNFSRGASHVISQHYKLVTLGKKGYRRVMLDLIRMADYLGSNLEEMGCFVLLSKKHGRGLPLVAFRLDPAKGYAFDEFAIAHELRRQGGWVVPAYTMAPHSEEVKILRVVVRQDFSHSRCDALVADLRMALHRLRMMSVARTPQLQTGNQLEPVELVESLNVEI